jgi:hypothetical protein
LSTALELALDVPMVANVEVTPEAVRAYTVAQRRGLARRVAGVPAGAARLPSKGTARRRRYDAVMRNLQRYATQAGERRNPESAKVLGRYARVALRGKAARDARAAQLGRAGEVNARLLAEVRVSSDVKVRRLPAGGPGLVVRDFDRVTRARASGDDEEVDAVLGSVLLTAYGLPAAEIVDCGWLLLWRNAERAPADPS